jgi:hypothetical protein
MEKERLACLILAAPFIIFDCGEFGYGRLFLKRRHLNPKVMLRA